MENVWTLFEDFSLSQADIGLFMIAAMMIGMAKAGVKGLGTASIPITVYIFGAKESTGIILPVLMFADTFTVLYYYKKTDWSEVRKLLPLSILGVGLATAVGFYIDGKTFQYVMGCLLYTSPSPRDA